MFRRFVVGVQTSRVRAQAQASGGASSRVSRVFQPFGADSPSISHAKLRQMPREIVVVVVAAGVRCDASSVSAFVFLEPNSPCATAACPPRMESAAVAPLVQSHGAPLSAKSRLGHHPDSRSGIRCDETTDRCRLFTVLRLAVLSY